MNLTKAYRAENFLITTRIIELWDVNVISKCHAFVQTW